MVKVLVYSFKIIFVLCFSLFTYTTLHSESQLLLLPELDYFQLEQDIFVSLNIDNIDDLYGISCDIVFDPTSASFDQIDEGNFLNINGNSTVMQYDTFSNNRIIFALSLIGQVPGVCCAGSSTVAVFKFNPLLYSISCISLENIILLDSNLEEIECISSNCLINIGGIPSIIDIPNIEIPLYEQHTIYLTEFVFDPNTSFEELSITTSFPQQLNVFTNETDLTIQSLNETGNFNITLTVSDNNFLVEKNICVLVNPITAIFDEDDVYTFDSIDIFPNPTRDNIEINSNNKSKLTYNIYNIKGQKLIFDKVGNSRSISLSKYPTGIYFIKFNNEKSTIKKIIKLH